MLMLREKTCTIPSGGSQLLSRSECLLRLFFAVTAVNIASYRDTKGAEYDEAFAKLLETGGYFEDLPSFLKAAKVKKAE